MAYIINFRQYSYSKKCMLHNYINYTRKNHFLPIWDDDVIENLNFIRPNLLNSFYDCIISSNANESR